MTLKELRNITAMLNTLMPDDAVIIIRSPNDMMPLPMENAYTPDTKNNIVTFYSEGY